jgi:hypothetical protein
VAPFRAIAERIGFAERSEVLRQREGWQREAATDFARHRTSAAIDAYDRESQILQEKAFQDRVGFSASMSSGADDVCM